MTVQNTLTKNKEKEKAASYVAANGNKITLTLDTVKNYLVSGDKERVTTQEVVMFINLCQHNGLDPWLKEAYLIKYGSEPATMIVSKEAFMKRAEENVHFNGYEAGVILMNEESGELIYRKGSFKLQSEIIVGGYAEVFRKDRDHSYREEVSFDEYVGRKNDGTLNKQWARKPATMIRKVALVHALREAFPGTLGGMYTEEEKEPTEPIDVPYSETLQEQKEDENKKEQESVSTALFGA